MAIYKSSFNKKPEKKEKPVKEKVKEVKEKPVRAKVKINKSAVWLVVFSVVFLLCVIPNNFFKSFVLGCVGLLVYPVCVVGIFFSITNLLKKKYNVKKKYVTYLCCAVLIIWFIFHLILTSKISVANFGEYILATYAAKTTAGGVLFGLLSFVIVKYLTTVGAYIVSAIALAIFVGLLVDYIYVERHIGKAEKKTRFNFDNFEEFNFEEKEEPVVVTKEEQIKKNAKRKLGLEQSETTVISSSMPNFETNLQQERPLSKREYILTPLDPIIPTEDTKTVFNPQPIKTDRFKAYEEEIKAQYNVQPVENEPVEMLEEPIKEYQSVQEVQAVEEEYDDMFVEEEDVAEYETAFETDGVVQESEDEAVNEEVSELEDLNEEVEENVEEVDNSSIEEITPDLTKHEFVDEYAYNVDEDDLGSTVDTQVVRPSVDISKFNLPNAVKKPVGQPEQVKIEDVRAKLEIPPYVAPPVELLQHLENPVRISDDEIQENINRLEQVLEDFKVPAKVNNVQVGPAVTRYELTMPRGISVNKIAQMADDIAMTLASNGAIRVEAPIPGKNSVGIEVPNAQVSPVSLRELIDSEEFRQRGNPLSFVLGRDINGDIIFCNLDKMPHVLVAGSTGSGKSVCLNTMLLSMCYKAGPQDLRLILVDPKMVEFTTYNGLPHLLIPEVITGKDMTINALDWAIKEMERRYAMFAQNRVVNIVEFNKSEAVRSKREDKIPYIVIVVDELADLMLEAKREIDDRINKLAAKARAAGIHLVLATQRPSVDVITGTVKANLPSRIAFALTNFMDSKTILDGSGAEKLLGKGDMLFKPQNKPEAMRVQGAYVSNEEIYKVVEFIKDNNNPVYDDNAGRAIKNPHQEAQQSRDNINAKESEFDPVLKDALRWFIQMKQGSGSMISRRYSVGFNRAGRIMDQMERAGFIGPQDGSKPRQVLITMDEYKAIFGDDEE